MHKNGRLEQVSHRRFWSKLLECHLCTENRRAPSSILILWWQSQLNRVAIGTCGAEWVPVQNLATPHLMRNCGSVLSLHCMLYVRLYMRKHAYAGLRAHHASSRVWSLWYEYAMLPNNPGNAQACPGLQVPMRAAIKPYGMQVVWSNLLAKWSREWVRDRDRVRAGARECNTSFFFLSYKMW